MNEAAQFYGNALRTSGEVIEFVCTALDEETAEIVAAAVEDGFRLAVLSDPTGLIVMLIDQRSGEFGPLIASVNGRTGRETIYGLRRPRAQEERHEREPVCR
ncbi:hypothetical protein AB4Y40_39100 [Paraburkholderia sp. EG287B]|uniref:hypothetical protein n=1 Tax=Paraburkholderia sp. EG287B TaxID=3237010 RepID=UPI0034D17C0A